MITSVGQPEIVTGVKSFEDSVKKNQCSFIIFFKNLKFCIIRVFTLLFFAISDL